MNILCLDLGSKTGWAAFSGDSLHSGVQDFSLKRGESPGMRFLYFEAWLTNVIRLVKPVIIVHEMAHHRGGHATAALLGMVAFLQKRCAESGIEHASIHSGSLKKHATGKGNSSKDEMIDAAKKRFNIEIIDDNHADALWILDWAYKKFRNV